MRSERCGCGRRRFGRWGWVVFVLAASACQVPHTQVDVRLVAQPTDYGAGVDHFVVRVFGGADLTHLVAVLEPPSGTDVALPVEIPLVPFADDARRRFAVEAALYEGGPSGRALGVQRAVGAFVQNERRVLELTFGEACEATRCERTETCRVGGECSPACVDEGGDPRACGGRCEVCTRDGCTPRSEAGCTERVTLGAQHTCALTGGEVYCWGANDEGQLGVGDVEARTSPTRVAPPAGRWDEFEAGERSGCGVSGGDLYCTGRVPVGAEGTPPTAIVASPELARIADSGGWSRVRVGLGAACGVHRDEIECFGDSGGRFGEGIYGSTWRGVDVAANHACAIDTDEHPRCWGRNQEGQLGDGTIANDDTPDEPAALLPIAAIRVSATHTCAIGRDTALYCWGQDDDGQLGLGDRESELCGRTHLCQTSPQRVDGEGWTHVSTGPGFTCGVREGAVYCWGRNDRGQLGAGDAPTSGSRAPLPVDSDSRFLSVECGGAHACGVTEDGELFCWGDNQAGQLGFPPGENASSPRPVRVRR